MRSTDNDNQISGGVRTVARRVAAICALAVLSPTLFAGCDQTASDLRESAERAVSEARQQTGSTSTAGGDATATQRVTVTRAVDGDTVEIEPAVRGKTDLRLIGVDTPELDGSEPLSQEAADFTERRLEGEQVSLTLSEDPVDPYGRLLGVVKLEAQQRTHGAALLKRGYAQTLFYEPNTGYRPLYEAIQENARQSQAGMWGLPLAQRCELASHGNGIGASSPECEGTGG